MITVRFPDGTSITGVTEEEVLDLWQAGQAHTIHSTRDWREELAKRAFIWDELIIDPTLPADEFLDDLAEAHMIKIDRKAK